jgi:addiction module RelE/StbE family toxin
MKIVFRKKFVRQYESLREYDRVKVDYTISKFITDPRDPILRNHALHGRMKDKRSFSVANNLRIIFEVEGDYITVFMLAVGSHNQVY